MILQKVTLSWEAPQFCECEIRIFHNFLCQIPCYHSNSASTSEQICACGCPYIFEAGLSQEKPSQSSRSEPFQLCGYKLCSHVWQFVTPWIVARQAPLSTGFSRQEYWSELPFPSPGDLPEPGLRPWVSHCRQILYHLSWVWRLPGPKVLGSWGGAGYGLQTVKVRCWAWVQKGKSEAPHDRFQDQGNNWGTEHKARTASVDRTTCCLITACAGAESMRGGEPARERHTPLRRLGNQPEGPPGHCPFLAGKGPGPTVHSPWWLPAYMPCTHRDTLQAPLQVCLSRTCLPTRVCRRWQHNSNQGGTRSSPLPGVMGLVSLWNFLWL